MVTVQSDVSRAGTAGPDAARTGVWGADTVPAGSPVARRARISPVSAALIGVLGQLLLLAILSATVGLRTPGWVIGIACAMATNIAISSALIRAGRRSRIPARSPSLGPAGWVTLIRATLVGGVAALVADSFTGPAPVWTMVALTAVALVLDAVDGRVARRTNTVSAIGARFDMEVDALAIMVLALYDVRLVGGWVLAIGGARYAFVGAGWLLPWLQRELPFRFWCKVVAAIQGVVLTLTMADVLPRPVIVVVLVIALGLLTESFGRDVLGLWRRRVPVVDRLGTPPRRSVRRVATAATTVLAVGVVWFALLAPNRLSAVAPGAFVRIPLEAVVLLTLVLLLPRPAGRVLGLAVGLVLGVLTLVKLLDMGFTEALDRPFNPVSDWSYLGPAYGVLRDSIGGPGAVIAVITAGSAVVAVVVLLPLAVRRLVRLTTARRGVAARLVTAFGVGWFVCTLIGVQVGPHAPLAVASAAGAVSDQVDRVKAAVKDQASFAATIIHDPLSITPSADLLTGLRGKDVVFVFVESYGRVAVEGSALAPGIGAVLDAGTESLRTAGFSARTGYLTSPTFGGISWLAHSSLQSGLWVDSQLRYDQLVAGDRFTLSGAFKRAGWRTVDSVPSNYKEWPEGPAFYHYDHIYDAHNVGYRGPSFAYANMPDQYTLSAFARSELTGPQHVPVMAEIDLVSSHTPWAPLPRLVDWNRVGDGSVFNGMPEQGLSPAAAWDQPGGAGAAYQLSIGYSMSTVISFVQTYGTKDLVVVALGDHQPATIVTGEGASHDVPITVIAKDPAVLQRISAWGWQDGLKPMPQTPVWPMDAFRNRFLTAFDR